MSYDVKARRERMGEIKEELLKIKSAAEAEERATSEEENAEWDKLEAEYNDHKRIVETEERFARIPHPSERKGMPNAPKQYGNQRFVTRSDANNAFRAWATKDSAGFRPEFEEAAERCNFRWRNRDLSVRLFEDYEAVERAQTKTNSEGGYTVNDGIVVGLEKSLKSYCNFFNFATVRRTSNGETMRIATNDDTANVAAYLAETTAVSNTSITFGSISFGAYKLASGAFPVSNELIQDSSLDIAEIVGTTLGERFGRKLAAEFTNGAGSGSSNITGLVGGTSLGKTAAADDALTEDDIIDHYWSVNEAYRSSPNCAWMMSSAVMAALMKLENSAGQKLLGPGLNGGPQLQMLGKPIVVNDSMPVTIEADAKVILFGDLSKYTIRIARDVDIVDCSSQYALNDSKAWAGFMRVDGKLVNSAAVKHLVMASGA